MKIQPLILLLSVLFATQVSYAQENKVEFDKNFRFTDGVYETIQQFRDNAPYTREVILSLQDQADMAYYAKLVHTESFKVKVSDSTLKNIFPEKVFGYCENNIVYVNIGGGRFAQLVVIGSICFLPVSPGGRSGPTISPSVGVGVGGGGYYGGGVGVGVGVSISGGGDEAPTEYIIHFNSGESAPFTYESLEQYIRDDEILYNEFVSLKKRDKKEEKYKYMHEYNQRHPIYFPVYE